jgi:hypothetical protein
MRFPTASLIACLFPAFAGSQLVAPIRSESAGVSIVTYSRDPAPRRFALEPASLEIGTAAGAEFHRVVSAIRMPNGGIVVADAGRREILRFGRDGALQRRLARHGAGPGEFTNLRSMHRHGRDSIVAHDGSLMRFAVFTDSGFVRQVLLQKSEHLFQAETSLLGLLANGRALVTSGASIALGDPGPARFERQEFPLVAYRADGKPDRLLGRYPGFELEIKVIRQGPLTGGFSKSLRLFGPTSAFGLAGENVIVVDNALFQFDVVDTSGRLVRRVRRQHLPDAVRPIHMAAYADERVSSITDPARKASRRAEHMDESHAQVFPALEPRIVVDAAQRVWLGSFRRPGDTEQDWWLFRIDGALVGMISVPAALTVTDAGPDYVLGIWRDEDGVQTIRQYRLAPSR